MKVIKRDGRAVDYDREKIVAAIEKANDEVRPREKASKEEIKEILHYIEELDKKRMLVEDIQDIINIRTNQKSKQRTSNRKFKQKCSVSINTKRLHSRRSIKRFNQKNIITRKNIKST